MTIETLKINEVFFTLQGEGAHAGRPALFVRMPFCDLKCAWCDTQFNTFTEMTEDHLFCLAATTPIRFAVLTGGEPMMNKQSPRVIEILKGLGFYVATETNGNWPICKGIDWVCCSPKRDSKPAYNIHPDVQKHANEFKYVVDDEFDFNILKRHKTSDGRNYWLSPEHNSMTERTKEIIEWTLSKDPNWRLSLQTHKIIGIR